MKLTAKSHYMPGMQLVTHQLHVQCRPVKETDILPLSYSAN